MSRATVLALSAAGGLAVLLLGTIITALMDKSVEDQLRQRIRALEEWKARHEAVHEYTCGWTDSESEGPDWPG